MKKYLRPILGGCFLLALVLSSPLYAVETGSSGPINATDPTAQKSDLHIKILPSELEFGHKCQHAIGTIASFMSGKKKRPRKELIKVTLNGPGLNKGYWLLHPLKLENGEPSPALESYLITLQREAIRDFKAIDVNLDLLDRWEAAETTLYDKHDFSELFSVSKSSMAEVMRKRGLTPKASRQLHTGPL